MFSTPAMTALFSVESQVQRMLDVEAALAQSLAAAGHIPAGAAQTIAQACHVEHLDVTGVMNDGVAAGTPVIPLVAQLADAVGEEARGYVHWGATSQDVIDTAMVLSMREALDLLRADMLAIGRTCARLAEQHRTTLMAGRTLLQQALPITFGLKAAQWLSGVTPQVPRLRQARDGLPVQLGGAAGTLAAYGADGLDIVSRFARELQLDAPALPWHTSRDVSASVTTTVALAVRAVTTIAADVVLLAQTEVAEVTEAPRRGKGGSSTMPHKRNPADAVAARAAARLALGSAAVILGTGEQEHERAAGAWQAEWAAVPDLFRYAAGALAHTAASLDGLVVDAPRMEYNLAASRGIVMAEALAGALAARIGRPAANAAVAEASATAIGRGAELATVAREHAVITAALTAEQIDAALDPERYLGSADQLITRALDAFTAVDRAP